MEDIGLDYSLYLHEMYISCCLRRASHVARDAHLMQMDYCVDGGRQISCSQAEGEEMVSDQGFDELPAEVCTYDTFHYCAQQESKQRAQPRFQGLVCLAASHQFAGKGSEKGAEDDRTVGLACNCPEAESTNRWMVVFPNSPSERFCILKL